MPGPRPTQSIEQLVFHFCLSNLMQISLADKPDLEPYKGKYSGKRGCSSANLAQYKVTTSFTASESNCLIKRNYNFQLHRG